jgi:hypothetical protein
MDDLRRNRQALTATVFQEGRPVGLENSVLKIEFPADSDFHAREARKSRHGDALGDVLEEHFGERPRLECRIAENSSGTPALLRDEPRHEATPRTADRNPATGSEASEERAAERANDPAGVGEAPRGVPDQPEAAPGRDAPTPAATDAARPDDTIGSEDEVFEIARQRLGPRDGGS